MMEVAMTIGAIAFFAFLAWLADKLEAIGKEMDK